MDRPSKTIFVVEDDFHAEIIGEYVSRADAIDALRRTQSTPWGEAPNCPPCGSWQTCQRQYVLIEYETSASPWTEFSRQAALNVSSEGARWLLDSSGAT